MIQKGKKRSLLGSHPDQSDLLKGNCKTKERIIGHWLIDSMETWGREVIDAEVRGYFQFGDKRFGTFQFAFVKGAIDYRIGERDGKPVVEFSWDGQDEMDSARGRGWFVFEGEDLKGMFYIHFGDESGIVLKRGQKPGTR
jgi:hypothetical protein